LIRFPPLYEVERGPGGEFMKYGPEARVKKIEKKKRGRKKN
jgi:hypothetical protein